MCLCRRASSERTQSRCSYKAQSCLHLRSYGAPEASVHPPPAAPPPGKQSCQPLTSVHPLAFLVDARHSYCCLGRALKLRSGALVQYPHCLQHTVLPPARGQGASSGEMSPALLRLGNTHPMYHFQRICHFRVSALSPFPMDCITPGKLLPERGRLL